MLPLYILVALYFVALIVTIIRDPSNLKRNA